jgi:hypothetical protein
MSSAFSFIENTQTKIILLDSRRLRVTVSTGIPCFDFQPTDNIQLTISERNAPARLLSAEPFRRLPGLWEIVDIGNLS